MSDVSVRALRKSYGKLEVLKGVDLDIAAGEFVALLGPSGCGKSTLLHAIAGLDHIDTGDIAIAGRSVLTLEPKDRGIAMVFQSYALYPTMSVRQNMGFSLRIEGRPKAEIARRVDEAAAMLQLTPYLDRKPSELSGGQRQRVAIGRALVRQAKVFLFDEPLSNLDAKLRTEMRLELKRLHGLLGATMIYVTHDQVEAMTMADRIAVLRAGEVVQVAAPEELYRHPADLFVAGFVGSPEINRIAGRIERGGTFRAGALSLNLSGYPGALPEGREAVLGLRPEDLRPVPAADPGRSIAARITLMEPLGSETLIWCDSEAGRLCLRLRPEEAAALPDPLHLAIDPARMSLFDAATTRRL
jgi:multiple sugar transport system ATP-binding protein